MANKIKNEKINKIALISLFVSVGLMVVAFALGFVANVFLYDRDYATEKSEVVYASSPEDISKLGAAIYNDRIYLTNDIHISDKSYKIGTDTFPFTGVFNGNGHTVYLDYTSVDESTSLFDYLGKGAVVENVNFVLGNVIVSGNGYGAIAKINDGTIRNCSVKYKSITISEPGVYSPLASINRGTIKGVLVEGELVSKVSSDKERNVFFGNACAYNSGTLDSAIALASFSGFNSTDELAILKGETKNYAICAVHFRDVNGGISHNTATVLKKGTHTADDRASEIEFLELSQLLVENKLYIDLDFSNDFWTISKGKIALKIKEG